MSAVDPVDSFAASLRRERAVSALLPLFFVSGATALVYQTLWARQLHLVFGTSTFAISTVLAAFMLGLAAGGFLMGRMADSVARPLAAYGGLEIVIGLYAVVFPFLVEGLTPVYLGTWRLLSDTPLVFRLVQFALVGAALLIPTAAMGATLPILARFATERLGAAGDRVGTLYAVNTSGAVFGTAVAGFWMLPSLGLWWSTVVAAVANLALGAAAVGLDQWARQSETAVADDLDRKIVPPTPPAVLPVAIAMGLAGFASLVYEVAWTRLCALMIGASVYAFSVMLLAFLVGIALGGKIGGVLADRLLARGGPRAVFLALAGAEVLIAVLSYGLMYVYPELPFWYVWIFDALGAQYRGSWMWITSLVVAGVVMTPPAVLMGIAFPMAVRAVVGREDALGGPVGIVYGANTLGGVLGAFLAGFVLLPGLHVQGTVLVATIANLAAAALCVVWAERGRGMSALKLSPLVLVAFGLFFGAQRPPWDPLLMTAGTYHYVSDFEDHSRENIWEYSVGKYDLLYYAEGLASVVTVARNKTSENIWLANNGKVEASTTTDMPTQLLCALLPIMFADDPRDVMVLGLASGITAGAVTLVPGVDRIDVIELEPAIAEAARYFDEYNNRVLDDPRTNLIHNDGRNHLLLSPPATYDVIISEPSNPWISGVSNLFTREFWEMGKKRLKPGGVWSQWVQMYGMDDRDLKSLLRTFALAYEHVLVFATIEDADLVLVGSDKPIRPTPAAGRRLLSWPDVRARLEVIEITDPLQIVTFFQFDKERILEVTEGSPLVTDDNMRIEYSAPWNLHRDTSGENFEFLVESAIVPFDVLDDDPLLSADVARAYQDREDTVRSVRTMAYAVELLPEDSMLREELLDEAERWQRELLEQIEEGEAEEE